MSFPLTHLLIADELLTRINHTNEAPKNQSSKNQAPQHIFQSQIIDAPSFLLGAIAPDAIHYRKTLPTDQGGIGPAKKITHLCPISNEPWGQVTDNDGWVNCVKSFVQSKATSQATSKTANDDASDSAIQTTNNTPALIQGYATHVLTDLYNNKTLWHRFRSKHPQEAAKGYASGYYQDLTNIDIHLYQQLPQVSQIWSQLAKAIPQEMPGLVSEEEIIALQKNILYDNYKPPLPTSSQNYAYVTFEESIAWIQEAADFVQEVLFSNAP